MGSRASGGGTSEGVARCIEAECHKEQMVVADNVNASSPISYHFTASPPSVINTEGVSGLAFEDEQHDTHGTVFPSEVVRMTGSAVTNGNGARAEPYRLLSQDSLLHPSTSTTASHAEQNWHTEPEDEAMRQLTIRSMQEKELEALPPQRPSSAPPYLPSFR